MTVRTYIVYTCSLRK